MGFLPVCPGQALLVSLPPTAHGAACLQGALLLLLLLLLLLPLLTLSSFGACTASPICGRRGLLPSSLGPDTVSVVFAVLLAPISAPPGALHNVIRRIAALTNTRPSGVLRELVVIVRVPAYPAPELDELITV